MEANKTKKNKIRNNNIKNNINLYIRPNFFWKRAIQFIMNFTVISNFKENIKLNKIFKKSKNNNFQFIPILKVNNIIE